MGKNCNSCKKAVNAIEKSYTCVACNCNMHLTSECTALSSDAITGIKEFGMNAMLLCNNCVERNERDNFIRCRTLAKVAEKIDNLDVGGKLKKMETRLTDLVDEKIGNATKMTCDKVEKTYAAVVAVETTSGKPKGVKTDENSKSHDINKCIKIQRIPEDPNKTKRENLVPTNDEVNDLLNSICANAHVTETQRLGKLRNDRKKPRAVSVNLAIEHETRITLAKSREFRKNVVERNNYMLPVLKRDDARKENQMLKKRRELLDGGVPKEKLKIRNLELYNEEVKVQLDIQNAH